MRHAVLPLLLVSGCWSSPEPFQELPAKPPPVTVAAERPKARPDLTLAGVSEDRLAQILAAQEAGTDPFSYEGSTRIADAQLVPAGRWEKESKIFNVMGVGPAVTIYLVDLYVSRALARTKHESRAALARALIRDGRHRLEIEKRKPVPWGMRDRIRKDLWRDLGRVLERRRKTHGRQAYLQLRAEVGDFIEILAQRSGEISVGGRSVFQISDEDSWVYFYENHETRRSQSPILRKRYSSAFGRLMMEVWLLPANERHNQAQIALLSRLSDQ